MGTLPETPLLKQKQILAAGLGISKEALLKAAASVPELRVVPAGGKYGYYRRAVVLKVFGVAEAKVER